MQKHTLVCPPGYVAKNGTCVPKESRSSFMGASGLGFNPSRGGGGGGGGGGLVDVTS